MFIRWRNLSRQNILSATLNNLSKEAEDAGKIKKILSYALCW